MSHSHNFFSSVVKTIKISSPGSWGEGWEEGIVREFGDGCVHAALFKMDNQQ